MTTIRRPTLDYTYERWIKLLERELDGIVARNAIQRLHCASKPSKIDRTPMMRWDNPPPNFVRWTTKPRIEETV